MEESLSQYFGRPNKIYIHGRLTCSNSTPWHRLDLVHVNEITERLSVFGRKKPGKVLLNFAVRLFRFVLFCFDR